MRALKKPFVLFMVFITFLFICAFLYYFLIVYPTNDLFIDIQRVFRGEKIIDDHDNPLWIYSDIAKSFIAKSYSYPESTVNEIKVNRLDMWHNGKKGYMSISYQYRYVFEDGSSNTPYGLIIRLNIEKVDGSWKVVSVKVPPP